MSFPLWLSTGLNMFSVRGTQMSSSTWVDISFTITRGEPTLTTPPTTYKTKKFSETEIKSPEREKSVENILIEKDIENAEKEVDNDSLRKILLNEVNVYGKYSCNQCYYQSIRKHNLISHVEIYHEGMGHQCPKCQFKANRKQYLQWHMKSTHDDVKYDCIKCEFRSTRKEKVKSHIRTSLKSDVISPARDSSEAPRSSSQYRVSQSVLCYLLPATVQRHRQCY